MKELIVLVGLPCSGKSTYVSNGMFYSGRYGHKAVHGGIEDKTYMILSTDDYIEEKAKALNTTYTNIFHDYIKEAEANLKARLKEAIDNGQNIIWDQTNLRRKKRTTILNSVPSDYKKVAVEFFTPIEVILKRNNERAEATGKFIGEHIIKNMNETREHVSEDEGFDQLITVKYTEPAS